MLVTQVMNSVLYFCHNSSTNVFGGVKGICTCGQLRVDSVDNVAITEYCVTISATHLCPPGADPLTLHKQEILPPISRDLDISR